MSRAKKVLIGIGVFLAVAGVACVSSIMCVPAWFEYGMVANECPDGDVRPALTVSAWNMRRGAEGTVRVQAIGHYTTGPADRDYSDAMGRFDVELALVDAGGKETPLEPKDGWEDEGDAHSAAVKLPDVPDGDYLLRARADTPAGDATEDVALALYAPARIHVITDRPLYEPGNLVRFRAVVLRAADLAPIEGRPGTWVVTDPTGEVLLEEKAPAGPWGVASGTFPLDTAATSGDWRVKWQSGGASDEVRIRVEPFTLPRFRVEATPTAPFYQAGQRPRVEGSVVYASGAPVAGAAIEVSWSVLGAWPPPTEWTDGGLLPRQARTDGSGHFRLDVPEVPGDLVGQATLRAVLGVTDAAGDRVAGLAAILLTEDAIGVSAVTELGNGLVQGFNNRLYLRPTTADGQPLPGTTVHIRRAWDATDSGSEAIADEDGVASFQVDPGPPVNVVVPAQPYRARPRPKPVRWTSAKDRISGEEPTLADRMAMDAWLAPLESCARFVAHGEIGIALAIRVDPSGAVRVVAPDRIGPLPSCAEGVLRSRRLPSGGWRYLEVGFTFAAPDLPSAEAASFGQGVPGGMADAVGEALLDARLCMDPDTSGGSLPALALWRLARGERRPSFDWVPDPDGDSTEAASTACIQRHVSAVELAEPHENPTQHGVLRFNVRPSPRVAESKPQPTTMLGYELEVEAALDGTPIGTTTLRMSPGSVPPLRLRANPVVAEPGQEVTVEFLRGDGFEGELPEKVWMTHDRDPSIEADLDPETRTAKFQLPAGEPGWFQVEFDGARALVFARPPSALSVDLHTDQAVYRPGDRANIEVTTKAGEAPVPAGVALVGVDESLGQLVPLPGPDDMRRLRPTVQTVAPAFGALDGQALSMGRIRGANAAAATVIRVTAIPTPEDLDVTVNGSSMGSFDPVGPLVDRFYDVLGELHARVRAWEALAPAGEQMKPPKMADLWEEAMDARPEARDAYGRTLRLGRLPADLLSQVDPRVVVLDGTRLPEDVEDWVAWVRKEDP